MSSNKLEKINIPPADPESNLTKKVLGMFTSLFARNARKKTLTFKEWKKDYNPQIDPRLAGIRRGPPLDPNYMLTEVKKYGSDAIRISDKDAYIPIDESER